MQKIEGRKSQTTIKLSLSLSCVLISGCFTPRAQGDHMRSDISKLKSEIAATQQAQGDAFYSFEQRLARLEEVVFKTHADKNFDRDKLETEVEQLRIQLEEVRQRGKLLEANFEEPQKTHRKLLNRTDQVAAIRVAYEDKAYSNAIVACDLFLTTYPDDKQFVPQILYWRGDSYFNQKEYKQAILSFQELLTKYQSFSKVPEALYKIGQSLDKLDLAQDAKVFYEEIIKKHPRSSYASKARRELKKT